MDLSFVQQVLFKLDRTRNKADSERKNTFCLFGKVVFKWKKVYWMHLDPLISLFCWLVGQYFESWILFISAGPSLAIIWWSLHRGDGFSKLFFIIKHLSQISSQLCWISHNVRLTSLGSSWLFKDLTLKSMFTDEILHLLSSSISKGGEWWLLLSMVP